MIAMQTIISFSVIRNHEFQTHATISNGRNGYEKNGETFNGKVGTWFQPFNSELSIQFHSPYRSGFSE